MFCPNCKKEILVIMEYNGTEIDFCPKCLGIWLDAEELRWILKGNFDEQSLFKELKTPEKKKHCPRCRAKMRKVGMIEGNQIVYDTCPNFHGFWFDRGELEDIVRNLPQYPGTPTFLQWLADVFSYSTNIENRK
ncbi:MAG TPA: zf-TFIIB domain-containing protein [Candidatus Hydrogenedens sp.]|nr:zf-TFIIB domain-containing protein [Candidatus Hydrogenedens sp.]